MKLYFLSKGWGRKNSKCRTRITRTARIISRTRVRCRAGVARSRCARRCGTRVGCGTRIIRTAWISRARIVTRTTWIRSTWVIARCARVRAAWVGGTGICSTGIRRTRIRPARIGCTRVAPGGRKFCRGRVGHRRNICGVAIMIKGNSTGCRKEDCAKQKSVFFAHFRKPSIPKTGRNAMPTQLPAKARPNHSQPCTLPEATPLKNAPILHPNARRAP